MIRVRSGPPGRDKPSPIDRHGSPCGLPVHCADIGRPKFPPVDRRRLRAIDPRTPPFTGISRIVGVGPGMNPLQRLGAGDVVRLGVEGLGGQCQRVVSG